MGNAKQVTVLVQNSGLDKLTVEKLDDGRWEIELTDSDNYQTTIYLSKADIFFFMQTVKDLTL